MGISSLLKSSTIAIHLHSSMSHSADKADINPYIPKFISNAPWYAGDDQKKDEKDDYLKHQRSNKEEIKTEWYRRGQKRPSSTKYRKGACQNCGSMGHKVKDCMERPRKIGAKYNGMNIRDDDDIQDISTTWESKRDRWNGFDAEDYKGIMNQMEKRQQETDKSETPIDEDNLPIKSLRERQDKAKYLENLVDDTVYFNPKSRTLRPDGAGTLNDQGQYARTLRDKALEYENKKLRAEKESIQMESGPTSAMMKLKELEAEKTQQEEAERQVLVAKYGGEQYLIDKPKELDVAPTLPEKKTPRLSALEAKSRYTEDFYPGNHSSVWGSYWQEGKWGYSCCHSFVKASYCIEEHNIKQEQKRKRDDEADDNDNENTKSFKQSTD